MNLANHPTVDELRDLLACQNDREGHHKLWISPSGEVNITRLPVGPTPGQWVSANSDRILLHYETFCRSNGWVGPDAARDEGWVNELFGWLVGDWEGNRTGSGVMPGL